MVKLIEKSLKSSNISESNPLFSHIKTLNILIENLILNSKKEWDNFNTSEKLSKDLGDKLIFFVFGKVNAGKSSFANLFTELSGKENIKRFHLDGITIQENQNDSFKVGQTETTSQIQWVEIGSLILVDSPGLFTTNTQNGDLTKKYLNSADAIIWLTSSGTPGQTQELEELIKEVKKDKPLIPIITKSDIFDEDVNDNGDIVKILIPKTEEARKGQELDVKERTEEFLAKSGSGAKLLQPISISAQLFKDEKIEESNIEPIFEILEKTILENAIKYKVEKPKKVLLNYFRTEIIEKIDSVLIPNLTTFQENLKKQQSRLSEKEKLVLLDISAKANWEIISLVEKYKDSKNTDALLSELNTFIGNNLNSLISKVLKDMFEDIKKLSIELDSSNISAYENITVEYEVQGSKRGFWTKLTEWDWRDRESSSTRSKMVGVDSSKVAQSIQISVKANLEKTVSSIFGDFYKSLDSILLSTDNISKGLENLRKEII